ncbi:MAG: alkaline phosphatase family protein [Caldilineaceae bacterium]
MKKVLLIIIDALTARVVNPALAAGRLPNLRRLQEAADVCTESIAIFPSITPAATSSIITGRYPRCHGISGAYWYIAEEKKVIYYGYDIWAVLEEGIGKFLKDFLVELNEKQLHAPTLFQMVENTGSATASLNYLIYHGDQTHEASLPFWLKVLSNTELPPVIHGPELLYFGDVVQTPLSSGKTLEAPGGMFNRYGFADNTTAELLIQLIHENKLPDFTLAYFPENDFRSHEVGPEAALDKLEALDEQFGRIFAAFGGLSEMLSAVSVVLTGDHSQSDVVKETKAAGIRLDQLLSSFSIAAAGTPMANEDDLVVCPNLRTAQIYFHTPTPAYIDQVMTLLLQDERVDQVLWRTKPVDRDSAVYHVVTQDRGHVQFWAGSDGPRTAQDTFGGKWSWEGDLTAVDGKVDSNGCLTFGDYPNAFERSAGILDLETSGHLWVTSRPGYEFCLEHTLIHAGGGSHGSLHELDSRSPLWIAGAPHDFSLPPQLRSVDVVPLCLSILDIAGEFQPGDSRMVKS